MLVFSNAIANIGIQPQPLATNKDPDSPISKLVYTENWTPPIESQPLTRFEFGEFLRLSIIALNCTQMVLQHGSTPDDMRERVSIVLLAPPSYGSLEHFVGIPCRMHR